MKANVEIPGDLVDAAADRANDEQRSLTEVMSALLAASLKDYAAGRTWLNPGAEGRPDNSGWQSEWEVAGRDRDGNLELRHIETGGVYRLLPMEDL